MSTKLLLYGIALVACGAYADSVTTNGYTWTYSVLDGKATITAVSPQPTGDLNIPSALAGHMVETIGDKVFQGCHSIVSIIVPEGVEHIGNYTFNCEGLKSIELPLGLKTIGNSAFDRCYNLKHIVIPPRVSSIGQYAFDCCESIPELELPTTLSTMGYRALCKCGGLKTLTIPFVGCARGMTGTSDSIFAHLFGTALGEVSGTYQIYSSYTDGASVRRAVPLSLETVSITDETVIPYGAFSGWNQLKFVSLNHGVREIGSCAFDGCNSLTNVTIPASVSYIGSTAFRNCGNLACVIVSRDVEALTLGANVLDTTTEAQIDHRDGYIFAGWTNASGCVVSAPFHSTSPVTVIPVWRRSQVSSPIIEPLVSTFFANTSQEVSISCETEDATILYTTDGSNPAVNGIEYSGSFLVYESCTIRAVTYDAGQYSDEACVTLTRTEGLSEAVNLYGYLMETDTSNPWTVVTDVSHDGVSCARSGAISHGGMTWLQTSMRKAGTVSFWWKAACEEAEEEDEETYWYDYGSFFVDGVEKAKIAGNDTGWSKVVVDVPTGGKHVLRWEYRKDGATSYSPDCIWLDQVQWIPADGSGYTLTTPEHVPYSWLTGYNLGLDSDFETAAKQTTGKVDAKGRAMAVWQDYVVGTDPTNPVDIFHAMITLSNDAPIITWSPNLNSNGEVRVYTVMGKTNLTDAAWVCPTNAAHRFFKVKVEMP